MFVAQSRRRCNEMNISTEAGKRAGGAAKPSFRHATRAGLRIPVIPVSPTRHADTRSSVSDGQYLRQCCQQFQRLQFSEETHSSGVFDAVHSRSTKVRCAVQLSWRGIVDGELVSRFAVLVGAVTPSLFSLFHQRRNSSYSDRTRHCSRLRRRSRGWGHILGLISE